MPKPTLDGVSAPSPRGGLIGAKETRERCARFGDGEPRGDGDPGPGVPSTGLHPSFCPAFCKYGS